MDVRCSRCSTEYEFDDALVSERGTTVKCTNCGHQFRVYPGGGRGSGPERWIVRKGTGRELVYTSLRELQRAIAQRQVGPSDMLSRGPGLPLRPLGGIAELEPFFESQSVSPQKGVASTLLGVAPSGGGPGQADDTVPDAAPAPSAPPGPPPRRVDAFEATMPSEQEAPRPTRSKTPAGGVAMAPARYTTDDVEPATVPRNAPPAAHHDDTTSSAAGLAPRAAPPPASPQLTPTPSAVTEGYRAYEDAQTDPRYTSIPPSRRRSKSRWIVALVVLVGLVFVGLTAGRTYFAKLGLDSKAADQKQEPTDSRAQQMLERGRALLNEGDFEGAKEHFDKASVLAEKDPKVRAAIARLEAARADVHWLALKLIDDDDAIAKQAAQRRLARSIEKVEKATDEARMAGADDPAVARARIDALRLKGELLKARKLVSSLGTNASDPETAYVLAALDLAEEKPDYRTVVDRLRTAAGVEGGLGRARAALIYSLTQSGAASEAKSELGKLAQAEHPHPLLERLRHFVENAPAADAGVADSGSDEGVDEQESPAEVGEGAGASGAPAGMDFRRLLEQAARFKASGDLNRAEGYYRAAREKNPSNVEALAGLGDVARMRGDTETAARYYDSVLASNPSYLPAASARADMKWSGGDRAGAIALYRRILQQAGPGTHYGQRAEARIKEYEGAKETTAPEPPPPAEPPAEPESPPPSPDTPHIDTSDLPGFGQ